MTDQRYQKQKTGITHNSNTDYNELASFLDFSNQNIKESDIKQLLPNKSFSDETKGNDLNKLMPIYLPLSNRPWPLYSLTFALYKFLRLPAYDLSKLPLISTQPLTPKHRCSSVILYHPISSSPEPSLLFLPPSDINQSLLTQSNQPSPHHSHHNYDSHTPLNTDSMPHQQCHNHHPSPHQLSSFPS